MELEPTAAIENISLIILFNVAIDTISYIVIYYDRSCA